MLLAGSMEASAARRLPGESTHATAQIRLPYPLGERAGLTVPVDSRTGTFRIGEVISCNIALRGACGCRREVASETFTKERLQGIAQKLDIAHGGAFDVGLTWLAPPDVILDLAEEAVIIGRYAATFPAFSGSSMPLAVQSSC